MYLKICDDTKVIQALSKYISKIKNAEKQRYAQAFWDAMYNESAHGIQSYPDTTSYKLGAMAIQAVQMRIRQEIEDNRTR